MSVSKEVAQKLIDNLKEIGITIKISLKPWPVPPFEEKETYIDFMWGNNLYASEKLSDINIEDILVILEKASFKLPSDWKKEQIRDLKLIELGF